MHQHRANHAGGGSRSKPDEASKTRKGRGLYGLGSALACLGLTACDFPDPPDLPTYAEPERVVWLDQGWTDEQRSWYHYASQGTSTIPVPYSWFVALERPEFSLRSAGLFSDPDYLARFGFLSGTRHAKFNPDGLPIGFARTSSQHPIDGTRIDQLGLTCAACHTGRIDHKGTAIMVDGAPAQIDLDKFRTALAISVGLTEKLPFRFKRFAARVLGPDRTEEQERRLREELGRFIERVKTLQEIEAKHKPSSVGEGVGRLDALNRIGDEVFGTQMGRIDNIAPRTAPVAFPHLWGTGWFDWVQYNGSIEQPMVRNAGEAMGVRGLVNFKGGTLPVFTSTIPIDNLYRIELLLMGSAPLAKGAFNGLRAPAWPSQILNAPNGELVAQGEGLYKKHCQSCHMPAVNSAEFWRKDAGGTQIPSHWKSKDGGPHLLRMAMIPVERIGTDPAQAIDMMNRKVAVPAALGLRNELATNGTDNIYEYADALSQVVEHVVNRWFDTRNPSLSAADRHRMNGERPNGVRAGLKGPNGTIIPAYKARPLDGIWATAPYLHNGSVPTLFHLLSPLSERPRIFYLGSREFDSTNVGYQWDKETKGGFTFDTERRGNWNRGHLFDKSPDPGRRSPGVIGPYLSPQQRYALIEYLKTL